MGNSNVPFVITSFERGSKYMLRRIGGTITNSEMVTVYNAGANARTGTQVLRFLTTGGQTVARRLTIPATQSIGVSAAIKVVTEPSSGGMEFFTIADRCDILYNKASDAIFFRANALGAWVAEVTLRDTSGGIIYGPTWHRRKGSEATTTTTLLTPAVAGTWYLAQVRFIDRSGGTHTYVDFGNSTLTPTGGAEWWIDDLYVCGGSLPLPANPVFGVILPTGTTAVRSQMTLVAGADVVDAVTNSVTGGAEPDEDTTYLSEATANQAETYKMAASGLGAANVLGATCWIHARHAGTGTQNPNVRAIVTGCFDYASAMQIDEAANLAAGDTTWAYTGGPPVVGDFIRVDDEIMQVTNAANPLTCTRGQLGTTDAAHLDNAAVYRTTDHIGVLQGQVLEEDYHTRITLTANIDNNPLTVAVTVTGNAAQVQVGDIIKMSGSSERMRVTAVVAAVLTVVRAVDGTTISAHTAGEVISYADYYATFVTAYRNSVSGAGITVAELDRLLFGARNGSSVLAYTSTVLLEYATHADAPFDWDVPRDGVKVV